MVKMMATENLFSQSYTFRAFCYSMDYLSGVSILTLKLKVNCFSKWND